MKSLLGCSVFYLNYQCSLHTLLNSLTSGFFCLLTVFQTVLKLLEKFCMTQVGKGLCPTSSCGCKTQGRFSDGNLKIQTVLKQQDDEQDLSTASSVGFLPIK